VKTLFGHMGEETILGSLRVIPNRLQELNFRFEYPQLLSALERIVG
jgi:NAD dependent epimerase/dehydratase family enzyme